LKNPSSLERLGWCSAIDFITQVVEIASIAEEKLERESATSSIFIRCLLEASSEELRYPRHGMLMFEPKS